MPEIKNLKKAAERIQRAVVSGERIVLYGDADIDGVTSVIILQEAIESCCDMSGPVVKGQLPEMIVYFPCREREGYGINEKALNYLASQAPALLIALDCGMGNVKEVVLAKKMGFEVMIIDHHQVPPGALPDASVVVNPKQKGDNFPFKHLPCAGVVYKLARLLLQQSKKWQPERFLGLVALAVLADKMPLVEENNKLVKDGALALGHSQRLGMRALMRAVGFRPPSTFSFLASTDYVSALQQKLLPVLNSAAVRSHINEAYLLLRERSIAGARKRVKALQKKAAERKEQIKRAFQEIHAKVFAKEEEVIVFEGGTWWPLAHLGAVASKICQELGRPTFLFQKQKERSRGAVRMPKGMDGVKAMTHCSALLQGYGGHAPAAGFTIKNENLDKFKKCLIEYFK